MLSKPFALLLLSAACVAAAGGGAYFASRQSTVGPAPASVQPEPASALTGQPAAPAAGVDETEAFVTEPEAPVEVAPAKAPVQVAPITAPPSRVEAPARRPAAAAAPRSASVRPAASPASRTDTSGRAQRPPAAAPPPVDAGGGTPSGLEKPWPSRTQAEPQATPPAEASAGSPAESEPAAPPPPAVPEKVVEELVVSADSVLGLQMETTVTSERAKMEDRVEARVTRDVRVGNDIAIPAGSRALGSVTVVERGGKVRERARLGIRFHTLVLGDGTTLPMRTETIYRDGDSPSRESAAKIGGAAIGGAIIGGIFGGKKGAILGGSVGAAGGTAAVMAGDRNAATIQSGSTVTVRLSDPITVTVER